jgi:hypothetical protein
MPMKTDGSRLDVSKTVASYVLVLPKRWPTHAAGIRGDFSHPAFSGIRKIRR